MENFGRRKSVTGLTDLPWRCEHQGHDTDFMLTGRKEADNFVPLIGIIFSKVGEIEQLGNIKNARSANGEFIARACNAYEELVAALKVAQEFASSRYMQGEEPIMAQIKAALVKAEAA